MILLGLLKMGMAVISKKAIKYLGWSMA